MDGGKEVGSLVRELSRVGREKGSVGSYVVYVGRVGRDRAMG